MLGDRCGLCCESQAQTERHNCDKNLRTNCVCFIEKVESTKMEVMNLFWQVDRWLENVPSSKTRIPPVSFHRKPNKSGIWSLINDISCRSEISVKPLVWLFFCLFYNTSVHIKENKKEEETERWWNSCWLLLIELCMHSILLWSTKVGIFHCQAQGQRWNAKSKLGPEIGFVMVWPTTTHPPPDNFFWVENC